MTTSLKKEWSPSRRAKKTLQMMDRTPNQIQMMMKPQVCLQDPGQEAKVPPPALVGTTSLSKCSFSSQPLLVPHQDILMGGHSGRLLGWASPLWREIQPLV